MRNKFLQILLISACLWQGLQSVPACAAKRAEERNAKIQKAQLEELTVGWTAG